jgi:multisubunit Na+/H+ antiporter MnhC subunit
MHADFFHTGRVADLLPQALVLTAIVIDFATGTGAAQPP